MIVALDFDETYTLDPDIWDYVTKRMLQRGHTVILATYRHEELDAHPFLDKLKKLIPCYFTDGMAKRPFLEELGIRVDVWIDDNPNSVLEDSAWKHDSPELHKWRLEQQEKLSKI